MISYYYAVYEHKGKQRFRVFTKVIYRDSWVEKNKEKYKAAPISDKRVEKILGKRITIFYKYGKAFAISSKEACEYAKRRKERKKRNMKL